MPCTVSGFGGPLYYNCTKEPQEIVWVITKAPVVLDWSEEGVIIFPWFLIALSLQSPKTLLQLLGRHITGVRLRA